MKQAIWNGEVIAESEKTLNIEGNSYFPHESIFPEFFKKSETHTTCHWKGEASYYTINVHGKENKDAAWFYPEVSEQARGIKNHVAFWRGVQIKEIN